MFVNGLSYQFVEKTPTTFHMRLSWYLTYVICIRCWCAIYVPRVQFITEYCPLEQSHNIFVCPYTMLHHFLCICTLLMWLYCNWLLTLGCHKCRSLTWRLISPLQDIICCEFQLLPDLEYAPEMTVLCVYNGPKMLSHTDWNMEDYIANGQPIRNS